MKVRSLVGRAIELSKSGRIDEAFGAIEARAASLGAIVWIRFASALLMAARVEAAQKAIDAALNVEPNNWDALVVRAEVAAKQGDAEACFAATRRLCDVDPRHQGAAVALAEIHLDRQEPNEAVAVLERFKETADLKTAVVLGRAYLFADNAAAAADLLGRVVEELQMQQRKAISGDEWAAAKRALDEVMPWHEEAVGAAYGREETINVAAARGDLDANAGVNYRLLGLRLAVQSERIADVLELRSATDDVEMGAAILKKKKSDARGLLLSGIGELRLGQVERARRTFEKACEADGGNFAAYLGLGAAMDAERFGLFKKARALPALDVGGVASRVVPDWANLTDVEKQVVSASMHPLRGALARLARGEAKIRVLPIDVRATDLPEFQDLAGVREEDDHRAYDAVGGLATEKLAVVKVEELIDVDSEEGWVFAHEFAHMVFFKFEERLGERVQDLLERAVAIGYVGDEYQRKNVDEFFAVSYTDFLRRRYGMREEKQIDDEGVMVALFDLFGELDTVEDFSKL
ncbi:MAG: hypothetical protein HYY84_04700 [Deltaproteobacteria bacterium]|nr:hypothetical protein [Deltaproteobacteria bacterium]